MENTLYGYADYFPMVAVVSPAERVAVTESMNRDLNRVSVWCDLWGTKLNDSLKVTYSSFPVNPIDSGWKC